MEEFYKFFDAARNNQRSLVRKMLEDGTDVDEVDRGDRTALMYAAYENATPVMNLLLGERCATVDWSDARGRTALMYAASRNQVDAVNLLLQFDADVNAQDENGHTALMYAICKDAPEAAKLMIDSPLFNNSIRDNDGWSAFMWAVVKKSTEIAEMLEDNGVKINRKDLAKILDEPVFFADPFDNLPNTFKKSSLYGKRKKYIVKSDKSSEAPQRDHSKYRFNGMVAGKAPTVYEVVKYYVLQNAGLTYYDLIGVFPDYLCPNGVIKKVTDIYSGDLGVRYNKNPIMLDDGTEVAVSNQWTKYTFESNFIEATEKLGLNIERISDDNPEDSSIKDDFIDYLQIQEGYKPNTAINYASSIEQVQRHYIEHENDKISFFYCRQADIERIRMISKYYNYGKYDDLSPKRAQWRNAMKAFVRFLDYKYPKPQRPKAVLIKKNKQDIE
jgi:hypothetical protein